MIPKIIGIPYSIKWEKKEIVQKYSHLLNLTNVSANKNIKLNLSLNNEKERPIQNNINNNNNINILEYNRVSLGISNDFILDPSLLNDDNEENIIDKNNDIELDSKILLKEKGTLKIADEEISKKLTQSDDKQLLKHVLKLMAKNKKNIKLLLPAEEDFNEKIPPNLFKIFEDERDKELPIVELSQFSNNIFLKLFQKCVNLKINKSETSVIIAIDCCRTIIKYIKLINVIFACGIANCLDSLEIPYSIVVFADYKFQYVIKDFNEPHSNEILQRILDCVLVSRYLTRIADACWFIKKKVECQGREKRAICLISNGLDPKLKIPEKWLPIFDNRDNECFNFFFINSLNEKDNIEYNEIIEIWKNFSSITGVEILDIKIEDIIKENLDYIANSFSKMFTKFKFSEAMNIKNKIYNPILLESYVINNEIEEKLISMLKSNINYKNIYIQNKPHINSKTKKIEDLKVPSNFMIQKVDIKYEIKENKLSHIFTSDIKDNKINLLDTIFPPNKATMYAPSTKGSRLYIKGLIYFILTNGQENKIWLEKKAGLKRDYRISIIIDSSRSCFNELMGIHSYQMIVEILSIFSYIQIPYLDIIIASENELLVLCLGQDSLNSLTINSPIWLALFEILGNPENNCNLKDCVDILIKLRL